MLRRVAIALLAAALLASDVPAPVPAQAQQSQAMATNVRAIPGDGLVDVEFTATGPTPMYWRVEYARSADFTQGLNQSTMGGTVHRVRNLLNDTSYWFRVAAVLDVDANTLGPWSDAVRATPRSGGQHVLPQPPSGVTASPGDGNVRLSWTTSASGGGNTIVGHELRHRQVGAARWTTVSLGSNASTHAVTGLTNGTLYELQVRAVTEPGGGQWSARVEAAPRDPDAPGPPGNLAVSSDNQQLDLQWEPPSDTGAQPITAYDVRYRVRGGPWTVVDNALSGNQIRPGRDLAYRIGDRRNDMGLTNHLVYDVQVRAVSSAGDGAWSATAVGTPPLAIPSGVTAISTSTVGTITVRWDEDLASGIGSFTAEASAPTDSRERTCTVDNEPSTWCVITGLTEGVEYTVTVVAHRRDGGRGAVSLPSAPFRITPDHRLPAPVLSATPRNTEVALSWQNPPELGDRSVKEYDVEARAVGTANWGPLIPPNESHTATSYTATGLSNGTTYEFRVTAVDFSDNAGHPSDVVTATPGTRPGAPPVSSVLVADSALQVHWSHPTDTSGLPVLRYDLRHTEVRSGGAVTTLEGVWNRSPGGDLERRIAGLTNNQAYDIQLRAVNVVGSGPWSSAVRRTPSARPLQPDITGVTGGDGSLTVRFADTRNAPDAIASYTVRYRLDRTQSWTTLRNAWRRGPLEVTISGLANGESYRVQVQAVGARGGSAWSPARTGTPSSAPGTPVVSVTNLAADSETRGLGSIRVSWTAAAANGAPVTAYNLRYRIRGTQAWTSPAIVWTSGSGGPREHTIEDLTNRVYYEVQVQAESAAGAGPWSASVEAAPPIRPPTGVTAVPTGGDGTALAVKWTKTPGARSHTATATGGTRSQDCTVNSDEGPGNQGDQCTIDHLVKGSTYTVTVTANTESNNGGEASVPSEAVVAVPRIEPHPPATITLTPGSGRLVVTWTPPVGEGLEIVRYRLRHRADGTDTWTELRNVWRLGYDGLGRPLPPPRRYTVGGLANGTTYEVQMLAVNALGAGPWSDIRNATPRAIPGAPTVTAALAQDRGLTVVWSAPANDGGSPVTGYEVRYRRTAQSAWVTVAWTGGALQREITGLANGVFYSVAVRAANAAGAGPWSSAASVRPVAAGDLPQVSIAGPSGPTDEGNDVVFTLSSSRPAPSGGLVVSVLVTGSAGFGIDAGSRSVTFAQGRTSATLTLSTTSDVVAEPADTVAASVQAGAGYGIGRPASASADLRDDDRAPGPPSITGLLAGSARLEVTWDAPAATGSGTITAYDVRHRRRGTQAWTTVQDAWTTGGSNPGYVIRNLANLAVHEVQVRAVSAAGDGAWSPTAAEGTPVNVPTGVSAVSTNIEGTIDVRWAEPPAATGVGSHTARALAPGQILADAEDCTVGRSGTRLRTGCEISGLTEGTEYTVTVVAHSGETGGGDSSLPSAPLRITPDRTLPAPANFRAQPGNGTVTLFWDRPPGIGNRVIASYQFRSRAPGGSWSNPFDAGTCATDSCQRSFNSPNGVTVEIQVGARAPSGDGGGLGYWSDSVVYTPGRVPAAPTITEVLRADGSLTFSWGPPSDTGHLPITSYGVCIGRNDRTCAELSDVPARGPLTFTATGLANGVLHRLQVRARNAIGEGSVATETATPSRTPAGPIITSVAPGDGSLTVTWNDPRNRPDSIVAYHVRWKPHDRSWWSIQRNAWRSGTRQYTIESLDNATRYNVVVWAENDNGEGDWSRWRSATPRAVPDAPVVTVSGLASRLITVSWTAAAANGAPVTAYNLRYRVRGTQAWTTLDDVWTTSSIGGLARTVSMLTNRVYYEVQVQAESAAGAGPWSASVEAAPPIRPPTGVTAVPTGGDGTALAVKWTKTPGARSHKATATGGTRSQDCTVNSDEGPGNQARGPVHDRPPGQGLDVHGDGHGQHRVQQRRRGERAQRGRGGRPPHRAPPAGDHHAHAGRPRDSRDVDAAGGRGIGDRSIPAAPPPGRRREVDHSPKSLAQEQPRSAEPRRHRTDRRHRLRGADVRCQRVGHRALVRERDRDGRGSPAHHQHRRRRLGHHRGHRRHLHPARRARAVLRPHRQHLGRRRGGFPQQRR